MPPAYRARTLRFAPRRQARLCLAFLYKIVHRSVSLNFSTALQGPFMCSPYAFQVCMWFVLLVGVTTRCHDPYKDSTSSRMARLERTQLENGVGFRRFDKVIQRGVCRQAKVSSQGRSTHAFRGQQRSQDSFDHRPAYLWRQFLRTKRSPTPPQAQDAFACHAEIVDPTANAVGSNQVATAIIVVQIHRGCTSLSCLATAYREQHHRTKNRQTHTETQQHVNAPTEDGHWDVPD